MAVAFSLLTEGGATGSPDWSTASVAPSANSLLLLGVVTSTFSGEAAVATASGFSLTWEQVETRTFQLTSGELRRRLTVLRAATAGAPGSGTVTISSTAAGGGAAWALIEVTGCTITDNGADGIVQIVSDDHTGLSPDIITGTLAALADANNGTLAFFGAAANAAFTTGETELANEGAGGAAKAIAASYAVPGVTAMDATFPTNFIDLAVIAMEIDEAGGGEPEPEGQPYVKRIGGIPGMAPGSKGVW